MSNTKGRFLLLGVYITAIIVMLILSYFYLFLFPILLLPVCILTSMCALRTKFYIGGIVSSAFVLTYVILVNHFLAYALLPVYFLFSAGNVLYIEKSNLRKYGAVLGGIVFLGFVLFVMIFCLCVKAPPISALSNYISQSGGEYVYGQAQEYMVYEKLQEKIQESGGLTQEETEREESLLREHVKTLDRQSVIDNYAYYVTEHMKVNFLNYIMFFVAICTSLGIVFCSLDSKAYPRKDYDIKSMREWAVPRGYTLGVFVPLAVVYVLGYFYDIFYIAYWSLFPVLILAPYVVGGASLTAYFITRKGKKYWLAAIIVSIFCIFSPVMIILGLIDKMLHLRKLLEFLDDTEGIS